MMTKKDYIKFADKVKNTNNIPLPLITLGLKNTIPNVKVFKAVVAGMIAEVLQDDNYRFDWDKFYKYIGLE